MKVPLLAGYVAALSLASVAVGTAEPVAVRVAEAPDKRALVLRSVDGKTLAQGDVTLTVASAQVTSRVVFRFSDGSSHDETTVFSQSGVFRLLSYRLVQSGPSFPRTLEMTVDTQTGRTSVRSREGNSAEEVDAETLKLSADLANGMMVPVLKNLGAGNVPASASWVAATPSPRNVKLAISIAGTEPSRADSTRRVTHYVVKVEIGGLAGRLAPLVGRQPPDTHVWIEDGPAPTFVKSEGPLYVGGPVWRIEVP
jgi:hypothetical protein